MLCTTRAIAATYILKIVDPIFFFSNATEKPLYTVIGYNSHPFN